MTFKLERYLSVTTCSSHCLQNTLGDVDTTLMTESWVSGLQTSKQRRITSTSGGKSLICQLHFPAIAKTKEILKEFSYILVSGE